MRSEEVSLTSLLALMALLSAALMLTACGADATAALETSAAPPATPVSVAEVVVRQLPESDEFTGRLEAVDRVELRPRVAGFIQAVDFLEGSRVVKGQVLFRLDPRPFRAEVDRLHAEKTRAEAQRELARSDYLRSQLLLEHGALSKEEFDRRIAADRSAVASLAAVTAALEQARLNLEFTRVTAPISGRVGAALVTEGNLVDGRSLLTTVVSVDPMYVNFDADESVYLKHARRPDAVQRARSSLVRVGLSDQPGYPLEGRFIFIDNEINPATGTIRARAVLPNTDGRLTAGLFARVKVESAETQSVTLIDDRAVGTDLGRKFVLKVKPDNTLEYQAVTIGPLADGLRVVREGLKSGDIIVVKGLQRVRPGATIAPDKVAMGGDRAQKLAHATAGASSRAAK